MTNNMINDTIKSAIINHAHECYPRECCGLLVDDGNSINYVACNNISALDNQFELSPQDYIKAEKLGKITAVVHSHPDGSTKPSMPDKVQMNLCGIPWLITDGTDVDEHYPDGQQVPLIGRDYHHGLLDCYTLIKDYYQRELDITMSDYKRDNLWWENKDNASLYLDNFKNEGFVEVDTLQKNDLILCRMGRTEHVNHALVFVGDGQLDSEKTQKVVGDCLVLHHPYNRQSVREIYGQQWVKRTHCIIRHKDLIEDS